MLIEEMGTPEDLIEIERAGRRCAVCQTGRRWRQFTVVRADGQQPVVMCPGCRARYGATAPAPETEQPASEPAAQRASAPAAQRASAPAAQRASEPAAKAASEPVAQPAAEADEQPETSSPRKRPAPREDRLKKALRELPHGEHSVGRIAKAAGLNHEKTLRRLHSLHAAGEVQQVGKRWSNEPPSTDIEAAMDRLQARTTNLRIVTRKEPVG
jgi:hypothetical protein